MQKIHTQSFLRKIKLKNTNYLFKLVGEFIFSLLEQFTDNDTLFLYSTQIPRNCFKYNIFEFLSESLLDS